MGTERSVRPQGSRVGPAGPDRQRIPLPPLPAFRRPPPPPAARGLSAEEAESLVDDTLERAGYALPPGPGHEGRPIPLRHGSAERSGTPGVAVLNDLVDEIEKDLEAEIERHADPSTLPAYGRVAGCSFSRPTDAGPGHARRATHVTTEVNG